MTIPVSRAGFFIPALTSYLEQKSVPYVDPLKTGLIEWNYPLDTHNSSLNPLGKIFLNKVMGERQQTNNKNYEFVVRLLVSDADETELETLLFDWQDLINTWFYELSLTGLSGNLTNSRGDSLTVFKLFVKIRLIESTIVPRINQSKGGTGAVISSFQWTDYESININQTFF
jgi:hypothetical protein